MGYNDRKQTYLERGYEDYYDSSLGETRRTVYVLEDLYDYIENPSSNYLPFRGLSAIDKQYAGDFSVKPALYAYNLPAGENLLPTSDARSFAQIAPILNYTMLTSQGFSVYYEYRHTDPVITNKVGRASSFNENEYPKDGTQSGYYWIYRGSITASYGKTGMPTPVYSTNPTEYPKNGLAMGRGETLY